MSDTVIWVENLSKKYIIGHQKQERYTALRDVIANGARSLGSQVLKPFGKKTSDPEPGEFWALKDVSFEVKQGDRVGIIGRNGAGKSTLLKILSRITEPTKGRISIKGRVASLLEVGTGFHPELTGRENIYLNGAILGMSKAEIKSKFDEIIAFAEVEKFLDTPVKRYSSGMYVRLAFAVAAHLESEVLVVDEVLAVGDAVFQKKCLGKMEAVSQKQGKTVLFVSHNINAIEQLCNCGILLEKGRVRGFDKRLDSLIKSYLFGSNTKLNANEWINNDGREFENPWFKPLRVFLADSKGYKHTMPVRNDSEIWLQIEAEIKKLDSGLMVGYAIYNENNDLLYWSYQTDSPTEEWPRLKEGFVALKSKIPKNLLNEGDYRIELASSLYCRKTLFHPVIGTPTIYVSIEGGLSNSSYWLEKRPGWLAPLMEWTTD